MVIALVVLKTAGVVATPWPIVLLPIWGVPALMILMLAASVAMLIVFLAAALVFDTLRKL